MSASASLNALDISISIQPEDARKDREEVVRQLAVCIIEWIKKQVPAGVSMGSHAAFAAPPGTGGMVTGIE